MSQTDTALLKFDSELSEACGVVYSPDMNDEQLTKLLNGIGSKVIEAVKNEAGRCVCFGIKSKVDVKGSSYGDCFYPRYCCHFAGRPELYC
jgi:hypothetical protein